MAAVNLVESAGGLPLLPEFRQPGASYDTAAAKLIHNPGNSHLFTDISSPDYDEECAHALTGCVLELLARPDG